MLNQELLESFGRLLIIAAQDARVRLSLDDLQGFGQLVLLVLDEAYLGFKLTVQGSLESSRTDYEGTNLPETRILS